jgi:succinoglycan biosynthesis transport protein ExoP
VEAVESGFDDVLAALFRRWRLILLVAGSLLAGVVLYAQSLPTTWTASATVGFSPRPSVAVGADTMSLIIPSYVSYVRSPEVEASVGAIYGVTATDLDKDVNATVTPATANLVIEVTSTSRSTVAGIANRLADAAVSRATQDNVVSAAVASKAVAPVTPSGPRRHLLELGGLLAAVILGALAAAVVERGFPRVRTSGDIRTSLNLEVVGRLPRSRSLARLGGDALDDPVVGVAVRALRNRLDITNRLRPVNIVAVCGSGRGEGRSTTAVALGQAIARLDARVLIIDADTVRRRVSTTYCPQIDDRELITVLEGLLPIERAVTATPQAGLFVLPTRPHGGVGDLFARRMSVVLDSLRAAAANASTVIAESAHGAEGSVGWPTADLATEVHTEAAAFDVVIIDTPPLLARDEAGLVARLADGVLLVVDNGRRIVNVREGAAVLAASGARVLGVVLNRASRRSVALGSGS